MANSGAHPNSASSSFPFERLPHYSEASSSPVSLRCLTRESCTCLTWNSRYLPNYTHRVALSNCRIVAVDTQHQTVTITYRDYRHGSQRKDLTLSALEFIRRFSLHILPPGLVRIRHYGILGNNRKRRDIEAARAIFKRRGCAVEFQPQSLVDPPCGRTCCPFAPFGPIVITDWWLILNRNHRV